MTWPRLRIPAKSCEMVSRTAWMIPWPPFSMWRTRVKLGEALGKAKPVSRAKVIRHILRGDFKADKVWQGRRYQWLIDSYSLAQFVAGETFRKHIVEGAEVPASSGNWTPIPGASG